MLVVTNIICTFAFSNLKNAKDSCKSFRKYLPMEEIKVINWINNPECPITKNNATTDDIALLKERFVAAGMTPSKFYSRVNYIGFDEWEIRGMRQCIEDYVGVANEEQPLNEPIYLSGEIDPSEFWQMLSERGAITQFSTYMRELGLSTTTLRRRMQAADFDRWEWDGVASIYRKEIN